MAALVLVQPLATSQSSSPSFDGKSIVRRGAWSSQTVSLFNGIGAAGYDRNSLSLPSPDGRKIIEVEGERVTVLAGGKRYATKFGEKTNAELGWAPDSHYFFLTWTDGGETGTWHTQLYAVTNSGLRKHKRFEAAARRDFARSIRHLPLPAQLTEEFDRDFWLAKEYCLPNVVGSQWTNGSQELVLSVLVPNVGICRFASEFNVYRVAVPTGKILQRYSAREAHQKFDPANLPRIAN